MLRGASAEARDALASALREQLESGSADAASIGEDLFGVAGLLRKEAGVRRILTDASVEGDAKAGLAGNVFGDALGEASLEVVKDAVRRRWTAGRDLADVLEYLGVLATVRSSGGGDGRVSDELFEVRQLVDAHHDLRSALSDPTRSVADKAALLSRLLDGKVQKATQVLIGQAVTGAHGAVDRALEDFQHIAADARNEKLALVHAARPLDEGEQERLTQALSRQYATTVHLQVVVDPSLIGGLRVEIDDDVIDGTVVGRLDDAQRRLVG
jgi:F-type H+-transporting ATPase subunit delta